MKVVLQSGHQNIQNNCLVALKSGTGAPGEAEFTVRVRDRLSQILISKGFQLFLTDANANCDDTGNQDYDLFLAIHYDANVYGTGGGFVGTADPALDSAAAESKRIRDAIASEYFKHTGIVEHNERLNANVTHYYMWASLSLKTPCILIECGVGQDAHDKVILADTDRVATAIARGICKAFNVAYDLPTPQPPVVVPPPVVIPPVVVPPVAPQDPCSLYKTKLTNIKIIASKYHFFYSGDFKKILSIIG